MNTATAHLFVYDLARLPVTDPKGIRKQRSSG
jgi:hypothetical protein